MQIQLKTRWSGYIQGDILTVSDDRGRSLIESGIARLIKEKADEIKDETNTEKTKYAEEPAAEELKLAEEAKAADKFKADPQMRRK